MVVGNQTFLDVEIFSLGVLTDVLRNALGSDVIAGCTYSTEPTQLDVHLLVDDETIRGTVDTIVEAHGTLQLTPSKTTIQADGLDTSTIVVDDAILLAGEISLEWSAYVEHELMMAGVVDVVDGVATLQFNTPLAGVYLVNLARQNWYNDGYVTIEAT